MTDKPADPADKPDGEAEPDTAKAAAAASDPDTVADSEGSATPEPVAAASTDSSTGPESSPRAAAGAAEMTSVPAAEPATAPAETVSTTKATAEPASGGAEAGPDRSRPRVLLGALAVAVLLLIGAVGVAGYLFVQERDKSDVLAAYDEVRQAACRYAPVLANYDAKNLDPYFAEVLAGATGDWRKEFETTTTELREALVAGQVVSTAGDIECAVKTADTTSAEVVVVIGQTIASLGTQGQPAPGQLSMVMRMEKTDGRWLVNQMITPLAPAGSQ